jgi:hypothetical protein
VPAGFSPYVVSMPVRVVHARQLPTQSGTPRSSIHTSPAEVVIGPPHSGHGFSSVIIQKSIVEWISPPRLPEPYLAGLRSPHVGSAIRPLRTTDIVPRSSHIVKIRAISLPNRSLHRHPSIEEDCDFEKLHATNQSGHAGGLSTRPTPSREGITPSCTW